MPRLFRFLLVLCSLFAASAAHAREAGTPLVLDGTVGAEQVLEHLEALEDPAWALSPREALNGRFVAGTELRDAVKYTKSKVWLRLRLQNGTADISD